MKFSKLKISSFRLPYYLAVSFLSHILLSYLLIMALLKLNTTDPSSKAPLVVEILSTKNPAHTAPFSPPPKSATQKIYTKDIPIKERPTSVGQKDIPKSSLSNKKLPASVAQQDIPTTNLDHSAPDTAQNDQLAEKQSAAGAKEEITPPKIAALDSPIIEKSTISKLSDPATRYPIKNSDSKAVTSPEKLSPQIAESLVAGKPLKTSANKLNYALSDYQWSFETYIEQWAGHIIRWWTLPGDYAAGLIPEGGSLWVSVKINRQGELLDFAVTDSQVSGEMEQKALQGLIASFELPELPPDFPVEVTFYWQFVYPPYRLFDVKKR